MENKQVTIKLVSNITQQNGTDTLIQQHNGTYHVVNGVHYIRFNDEITGKNTLKIDRNILTCLWETHAIKRIMFSKDERSTLLYYLPQGIIAFDVETTDLHIKYNTQAAIQEINLCYRLLQDSVVFGEYHLHYQLTF